MSKALCWSIFPVAITYYWDLPEAKGMSVVPHGIMV